tara:strand:+ start:689 stop:1111 length:423 start_codon:yes stop_codon:yes gene_type:complete
MQTTTGKTRLPSSLTNVKTEIRTPKRRGKDDTSNPTIQRQLRRVKDLYEMEEKMKPYIQKRRDLQDEIAVYMEETNLKKLSLKGTTFNLIKKQTAHWTFSLDVDNLKDELDKLKQLEKDIGTATNSPTTFTQVHIEKVGV